MKIFRDSKKLEIMRDIIRESFLGNAVIVLLVAEIYHSLKKELPVPLIVVTVLVGLSLLFVITWLIAMIFHNIKKLVDGSIVKTYAMLFVWVFVIEMTFAFSLANFFHKIPALT